jgi:hypothetical protein
VNKNNNLEQTTPTFDNNKIFIDNNNKKCDLANLEKKPNQELCDKTFLR